MEDLKVVAAFCGTGKTTLAEEYPEQFVDLVCMPYKYVLPNVGAESGEAKKASLGFEMNFGWPYNYVDRIIEEVESGYKVVLIPSDMLVLSILHIRGISFCLCYPDRSLKQEYKERFLKRGNNQNFLDVFVGSWNEFIDAHEACKAEEKIVMQAGEYLADILSW